MKFLSFYYILFVLSPFTIYGVFKFVRWWLIMVWQKKTDAYNTPDDWFFILTVPPSIYWSIASVIFLDTKSSIPTEVLFIYWSAFFFGPFTYFLAFLRLFNFGNTKLGKAFGCYPPTEK